MANIIKYLKEKNYLNAVVLFIVVFLLYGNTLKNEYSLDDDYVVENNKRIQKGITGIPKLFTKRYSSTKDKTFGYRPIVLTTFAIEYSLFGENTTINHFVNVFIYFLISLILLKLLLYFFSDYNKYFVWSILLIFIAHPVHTEVVASLKNRDELLSFLFSLLSLFYLIKYVDTNKILNIGLAVLMFIIAYLSKQSVVAFILLIPLSLYFFTKIDNKRLIIISIVMIVVFLASKRVPRYFLPKVDRINEFFENPLFANDSFYQRILTAIYTAFFYIKLTIFPKDLSFYYGYNTLPINSIFNIKSIISILFHLSIFIYAIIKLPKKHPLSFGILFYLFSISIFLNIVRPVMGIVADRYLFSAIFGFSIVIIYLIFKTFKIDLKDKSLNFSYIKNPIYLIGLIFTLYSFRTINRNGDWYDRFTLYSADIEHLENSTKANELLANMYYYNATNSKNKLIFNKNILKSKKYYKQTLNIYNKNDYSLINLSYIYISFKQADSALYYLNKVSDTTNVTALFNKAQSYELLKDYNNSIYFYKKTLRYDSLSIKALTKSSMLLNHIGKKEEAIKINIELIKNNKNYETPYINLANLYYINSDTLLAVKYAEDAIKINPKNKNTINLVFNYYKSKNNKDKMNYYSKIISNSDINK